MSSKPLRTGPRPDESTEVVGTARLSAFFSQKHSQIAPISHFWVDLTTTGYDTISPVASSHCEHRDVILNSGCGEPKASVVSIEAASNSATGLCTES